MKSRSASIVVCGVFALTAYAFAAAPDVDAAFRKFFDAKNPGDAAKAASDVVRSGVTFDAARARLERGRTYSPAAPHGALHLMRRTAQGDFAYDLVVPGSYSA